MRMIGPIIMRIVAVFMYSAMAVIGGASLIAPEIPPHKAAMLAGISATAHVSKSLPGPTPTTAESRWKS